MLAESAVVTLDDPLSDAERGTLAACEGVLARGLNAFVEVGLALETICAGRLYRESYRTFADYCRAEWGIADSRARQLRRAALAVQLLVEAGVGDLVENEGQARAVIAFDPDLRVAIAKTAKAQATAEQRPMSADLIASVGTVLEQAVTTGAVDPGNGESTVLTAALSAELAEAHARRAQAALDRQNRKSVAAVVTDAGGDGQFARIAVSLDEPDADLLRVGQTVRVLFTPAG